ncbi:MAG: phage recombination protein Bet [Bacteroidales bacterium]|jgi:phage recombination protein Bet|nr:phage recombination protein Bet [Bacteroidales bacterium]
MSNETKAVATPDKGKVTYSVAGQDVTLSYQIVRNFLTKGNGQVSDQDLTQFICICKYNQLNPFLNEAYLVKFGDKPAQMIVSKEALMKRAEACEQYEGIQAGIIVMRNNEAVELEGCFYLPTDKLAGGWAKVFRKDRKFPIIAKVRLEEYDKKQSTWNEKQSTMISKVAKVQALREAFPAQLGAMYTQEESNVVDTEYIDVTDKVTVEIKENANAGGTLNFDDQPKPEDQQPAGPGPEATQATPKNNAKTPGF